MSSQAAACTSRPGRREQTVRQAGLEWSQGGAGDTRDLEVIFGRDDFDFWQPLGERHLELVFALAHHLDMEYLSPFWSRFFFSYLSWQEGRGLTTVERQRANNRRTVENASRGRFSPVGTAYRRLATACPGSAFAARGARENAGSADTGAAARPSSLPGPTTSGW